MLLIKMDNCVQAGETWWQIEKAKDFFCLPEFSTHGKKFQKKNLTELFHIKNQCKTALQIEKTILLAYQG